LRSFAERANNIELWSEMPSGGHIAAHDARNRLAADIRSPLSLRKVEDLLDESGIEICHETLPYW
jgi:hypothetical protein